MKKMIYVIAVFMLLCASMCGCGAEPEQPAEPAAVGMPNPVKDYVSSEEQVQAVGLALEAPEGASDVRYQSIEDMAQTVFSLDGVEYCYRAQPTAELEAYDMSGLYYTFAEPVAGTVLNREAAAFVCDEAGFVQWLDIVPGINYSLGTNSAVSADKLFEVANLVFVPVQGDVG